MHSIFMDGYKKQNLRRYAILAIAVFAAALMTIPALQFLEPQEQQTAVTYSSGNEFVQFSGSHAYVGFGTHVYPVTWSVVKVGDPQYTAAASGGTGTHAETFSHHSSKRIHNRYQDSAVLLMNNSEVRIAEIYSFLPDGIDASIAVENVGNASGQFLVAFALKTHYQQAAEVNGFYPGTIHTSRGMENAAMPINTNDWSLSTGNVSVDWKSESSIFHAGILAQSLYSNSNVIDLAFGSLNLACKETYSIDPVIRPMMVRPPVGVGGCGGGSPAPSLISWVSFSPNQFSSMSTPADTPITVSVDLSSMGGYDPVNVQIFSVDKYYNFNQIYSTNRYGTGVFSYTWYSQPGAYIGFAAYSTGGITVASPYYSTSNPLLINTSFPFELGNGGWAVQPDSVGSGEVFDSNGVDVGSVSQSTVPYYPLGSGSTTPTRLHFSTGFWNRSNGLGAWSVDEGFVWKGNTLGDNPSNQNSYITNTIKSYGVQGNSASSVNSTEEDHALWDALGAGIGFLSIIAPPPYDIFLGGVGTAMAILGDFMFYSSPSTSSNPYDQIWQNFTGSHTVVPPFVCGEPFTSAWLLLTGSGGDLSHLFEFTDHPMSQSDSRALNYFLYEVHITLVPVSGSSQTYVTSNSDWDPAPPGAYTTSISMPIDILQG